MAKLGVGMVAEIIFDLIPIGFIVAYLLAGCTNGDHASQGFNLRQGILKLIDQFFTFHFRAFTVRDSPWRCPAYL